MQSQAREEGYQNDRMPSSAGSVFRGRYSGKSQAFDEDPYAPPVEESEMPRFRTLTHTQRRLALHRPDGAPPGFNPAAPGDSEAAAAGTQLSASELRDHLKERGYSDDFLRAVGNGTSSTANSPKITQTSGAGKKARNDDPFGTATPYTRKDLDQLNRHHNIATGPSPDPLQRLREESARVGGGAGDPTSSGAEGFRFRSVRALAETNFTHALQALFPDVEEAGQPIPHFEASLIHSKFPHSANVTHRKTETSSSIPSGGGSGGARISAFSFGSGSAPLPKSGPPKPKPNFVKLQNSEHSEPGSGSSSFNVNAEPIPNSRGVSPVAMSGMGLHSNGNSEGLSAGLRDLKIIGPDGKEQGSFVPEVNFEEVPLKGTSGDIARQRRERVTLNIQSLG